MDAETLYNVLREAVESVGGFINDYADEMLGNAATAIADDENSELD